MKYLEPQRDLNLKIRIFRRYILNVRKLPVRLPLFISRLTEAQSHMISKYSNDFDKYAHSYNLSEYHRALYLITRILNPEKVIETGVFEGYSSLVFLLALKENNKGYLYSVDLPSPSLPQGKEPGWIVPEQLRKKWDLRLGKSSDLLLDLLTEVKEVDIFLHDSEHSFENMSWEYNTVWPYTRKGGVLLSHDVSQNPAFRKFSKHVSENYYYMLKNLAGIKRTK